MQIYKKEIIQTNNLPKNEKIQRNNSAKIEKIQRNILKPAGVAAVGVGGLYRLEQSLEQQIGIDGNLMAAVRGNGLRHAACGYDSRRDG